MRNFGLCAAFVVMTFAAVLAIYATQYSLHQDLAGGVLTGRLASELGAGFDVYNAYFPPIERFWYTCAAAWAGWSGVGLDLVVVAQTLVAVLISAALGYVIRRQTYGAGPWFFVLPFLVLLILPILYKNIFGLREHLIVLGLWPYLVLRAAGDTARNLKPGLCVILGLWMGFTLLFKYFYAIAVFFVELADALIRRQFMALFRIENLVSASVVFVYLLLWLGIDPAQREAVMSMRGAIAANILSTEGSLHKVMVLMAIGLGIWLLLYRFRIASQQRLLGLAALTGAVVVAWLQQRWYTHHLFPVFMAFVGWWWLVGASVPRWLHVLPVVLLAMPLQEQFLNTRIYQQRTAEVTRALETAGVTLTDLRVGLLNQHPSPFNQVLAAQGGVRWSPQMNIAYVSSELLPHDTLQNHGQEPPPVRLDAPGARLLHDNLMALWRAAPPDVLILDTSRQWPLRYLQFSWEKILSQDPAFQQILAEYEPLFTYDTSLITFTYYVRSD